MFIPGLLEQVFDRVGYTVLFSLLFSSQSSVFHIFGFKSAWKSKFGEGNFQFKHALWINGTQVKVHSSSPQISLS